MLNRLGTVCIIIIYIFLCSTGLIPIIYWIVTGKNWFDLLLSAHGYISFQSCRAGHPLILLTDVRPEDAGEVFPVQLNQPAKKIE